MTAPQKLLSFWVWMLLVAALCPGAQYAYGKPGGLFRGRGKGDANKGAPSQGRGLPKQGLKWAGAAAAGMLGGTGTGYGLGFLGKPKHGSRNHHHHHHHGHNAASSEQDPHLHHRGSQTHNNQSLWRVFVRGAAPEPVTSFFLTLGHVVPFLTLFWLQDF